MQDDLHILLSIVLFCERRPLGAAALAS